MLDAFVLNEVPKHFWGLVLVAFENGVDGNKEERPIFDLILVLFFPLVHQWNGEVVTSRAPELKEIDNNDLSPMVGDSPAVRIEPFRYLPGRGFLTNDASVACDWPK